jgi:hypothetical protein
VKNPKLIEIIRTAADWIENNLEFEFDWCNYSFCTCGAIVKVANELEPSSSLTREDLVQYGFWSRTLNKEIHRCSVTGESLHVIVQTLLDLGLTPKDIKELEFAGNYSKGDSNMDSFVDESFELYEYSHNYSDLPPFAKKNYVVAFLNDYANRLEAELNQAN